MKVTIESIRELQGKMWDVSPPRRGNLYGSTVERGTLSKTEVDSILAFVQDSGLVCETVSVGFGFGGIGLVLYQDESYPGVGPEFLFCLSEKHLSPEDFPWIKKGTGGSVRDQSWELFKIGREPRNVERLTALGLRVAVSRASFDY